MSAAMDPAQLHGRPFVVEGNAGIEEGLGLELAPTRGGRVAGSMLCEDDGMVGNGPTTGTVRDRVVARDRHGRNLLGRGDDRSQPHQVLAHDQLRAHRRGQRRSWPAACRPRAWASGRS